MSDLGRCGPDRKERVPAIVRTDRGYRVRMEADPHPLVESREIEWIKLLAGDLVERVFLNPGQDPEADFSRRGSGPGACRCSHIPGLQKP